MVFEKIGGGAMAAMTAGLLLAVILPIGLALAWKFIKKERFTTVLAGAGTFLVFAIILEKSLQSLVIGLDHPLKHFLDANPIAWCLVVALFPGIFEEAGRFVVYKTILRKRKNRETSVSHGIGHGGFEVIFLMGTTYLNNIIYAVMINTGAFAATVEQTKAIAPDQADQLIAIAQALPEFAFSDVALGFVERIFALAFHIGASIIVFYACKDSKKVWLFPLAIVLHTIMDFYAALYAKGMVNPPVWLLEAVVGVFGLLVLFGAYFFLYRKDKE